MSITPEKIQAFRSLADTWLAEAQYEKLSPRPRADAAFDSIYMRCRVVMAGADETLTHPHPEVLTGAADRLGWSPERMATPLLYLDKRDNSFRGANQLDELLAIALQLKEAVDPDPKTLLP